MQKRKFDELISHFNRKVSDMSIDQKYKMELLGMISAIGFAHEKEHGTNLAEVGTDCISRQAVVKFFNDWISCLDENCHHQSVADMIIIKNDFKNLPSAQPQIIRCKDCKHWIPYDWMFNEVWQSKNIADYPEGDIGCALSDMAMKANDFCRRGERRTE